MKNLKLAVYIIIFLMLTVAASSAPNIDYMMGDVKIKRAGSSDWVKAKKGIRLRQGDQVKTGKLSYANIDMDGNAIKVGANSHVEISMDIIDEQPSGMLSMFFGSLSLKMDRLKKNNQKYGVKTPSAVAAVRGTEFNIVTGHNGKTVVQVSEGEVSLTGVRKTVSISANQQSSVEIGKDPEKVTIITRQDWDKWLIESEKNAEENAIQIFSGALRKAQVLDAEIKAMEKRRDILIAEKLKNRELMLKYKKENNLESAKKYQKKFIDTNRRSYALNLKIKYKSTRIALIKKFSDNLYSRVDDKLIIQKNKKDIDKLYKVYYIKYIKEIEEERMRYEKNNSDNDAGSNSCIMF